MAKKKRKNYRQIIQGYANRLNTKLPKSEEWFWREWNGLGMKNGDEIRNVPFAGLIPDVRCKPFRYIIEVDGSIHDRAEVKLNDLKKTKKLESLGYRVFRLPAYDYRALLEVYKTVKRIRESDALITEPMRRVYGI